MNRILCAAILSLAALAAGAAQEPALSGLSPEPTPASATSLTPVATPAAASSIATAFDSAPADGS